MSKKKRYMKQPEIKVIEKVVEIHKQPTLQEAWDVVCEHIEVMARQNTSAMFIDYIGSHGRYGVPNIHYIKHGEFLTFVEASKPFKEGW
ncbi:hypothetical protein [Bacillus sp. Fil]|uniref:hypothetical protein n=1 Tax=Bacillus sp. Fil TaxID=3459567 RepID=UPI00403AEC6F